MLATIAAFLTATTAACAAAPTPPPRFGAATAEPPTAAPAALPTVDIATRADLERLLTDAGIPWTYDGEKQVDWFETVPHIYHVGDAAGNTLEVHIHPDPAAAQAAAARVSPGGATILDAAGDRMQVLWGATPHFYQKGPFLVIFVGDNPAVRETLTRAFGPQFAGG